MNQLLFRHLLASTCLAVAILSPAWAGGWELVAQGDCPGTQVIGSAGNEPEAEICTADFAGKTALCFTQVCNPGCQYIDVPTHECRGGTEMAYVYTCVSDPSNGGTKPAMPKQVNP